MDQQKIGKFICSLRKKKNLSQTQLADMIPISRQAVSKWERGITIPDSSVLIKLSEIFAVSINEILAGEKIPKKSIKTLEKVTLNILDETNEESKKIKKISLTFTAVILILLITFLSYYFLNSYNSIKVYRVDGEGKNFATTNGIFITTRQKTYFRLGEITHEQNVKISKIKLYYKIKNKDYLLVETESESLLLTDYYGYDAYFPFNKVNTIIKNLYLQITFSNSQKETIKLNVTKDFSNNNIIFQKKTKISDGTSSKTTKSELTPEKKNIIESIKNKGIKDRDGYIYETVNLIFVYFEKEKQLEVIKTEDNQKEEWFYFLETDYLFYQKSTNTKIISKESSSDKDDNLHQNFTDNYLNKYLLS